MKWFCEPNELYKWDQGKKITRLETGICMGVSVALSKHLIDHFQKKRPVKISGHSVYKVMRTWLNSHGRLALSRKDQKRWGSADVPKRTSASMTFDTDRLYLLGLTFSLTGGYFTHLSLLSNLYQYVYESVDHAALLYVAQDSVIAFEPNWGLGLWDRGKVAQLLLCDVKAVENLLEGGYHSPGEPYKYAVNILEVGQITLGKNPKSNINPKLFA